MPTVRESLVATVTRRYPFVSGCATFANSSLVRRFSGAPSGQVWAPVSGGKIRVSLDDYVGRAAYFVGDLDRKITHVCSRVVRPGDVVLDVGANIGLVTLPLARLVGPTGRVHAFEPNPRMQEAVAQMVERNDLSNVVLHRMALGEAAATMELAVPMGNAGAASLVRRGGTIVETVSVPVATLAEVARQQAIDHVRLIKMDVEGFEFQVIRGAGELLSRQRIDAILFELNERTTELLRDEPLIRMLHDSGYSLFAIPKFLLSTRLRKVDLTAARELPSHDFLAVPADAREQEIGRLVGLAA